MNEARTDYGHGEELNEQSSIASRHCGVNRAKFVYLKWSRSKACDDPSSPYYDLRIVRTDLPFTDTKKVSDTFPGFLEYPLFPDDVDEVDFLN